MHQTGLWAEADGSKVNEISHMNFKKLADPKLFYCDSLPFLLWQTDVVALQTNSCLKSMISVSLQLYFISHSVRGRETRYVDRLKDKTVSLKSEICGGLRGEFS